MNSGILQFISAHIGVGADNATSSATLQSLTGLTAREVRKSVETLRRSGCVICSDEHGYYRPASLSDVQRFIKKESRRARSVFYTLRSARSLEKTMQTTESKKGAVVGER